MSFNPERILVIPLRYIGDTVLTVPLIRNLRHHFPQATIDVLASPVTAGLLEPCPYLNNVLLEPKTSMARLRLLKQNRYDAVFLLRKSVSMALLCKLAGIKTVVGYDKQRNPFGYKRWGWFLDKTARYPSLRTEIPQVLSHLGMLEICNLPPIDDQLELWATEADVASVNALLHRHGIDPEAGPLAVLHAASASHGKQIELGKFAESVRHLHGKGYQVLATGAPADRPLYEALIAQGLPLINLAGETSLRETFALYRQIELLLTVDSSPIHIGAAAGVPRIVGVFGPTNERQWGPHTKDSRFIPVFLDLPCRPCYAKTCEHNNCRMLLTDLQIADAVRALA